MYNSKPVDFTSVELTDGFWQERQTLNREVTIRSIEKRFRETGRFDAFRMEWKPGQPNQPHIFWDSDIAKWIESVAYILAKRPDPALERSADEAIEQIIAHQEPNGYFNIWFTVGEPDKRFTRRTDHELYCAGHLIEAAVAYAEATGKDAFVKAMCRYADLIDRIFRVERSAPYLTPGHEEIELALVKLYRYTGEERYLALSRFFVDHRGEEDPAQYYDFANAKYAQDHLPVREQTTAEGHAVRATYLYCAMADLALEEGDQALLDACRAIFRNVTNKRMYITGGIGSEANGEAFTLDYDLPNRTAYAESCAAIGLIFWASRMLQLEPDSLYADTAERALYNGFLSSTSLDGKAFFYENPLELTPALAHRNASVGDGSYRLPISRRQEVFGCSCCPPNITRLIASLGNLLYTQDGDTLYIHHYMASRSAFHMGDAEVQVVQETDYPRSGQVKLTVAGAAGKRLAVRIPGWCRQYTVCVDEKPFTGDPVNGYLLLECGADSLTVTLNFEMKPMLVEASSNVLDDCGLVAVQRGPVVYCIEEADNGENLRALALDRSFVYKEHFDETFGAVTIDIKGWRKRPSEALYHPVDESLWTEQTLRFIPYYGFANRKEGEMLVWTRLR